VISSDIRIEDGGVSIGRTFGARRLKALLLLSQHPELDDPAWQGSVQLHFAERFVKGAVHPTPVEITL
jgi:hypothetical protein